MTSALVDLQVGDTAPLLFPMVIKPYGKAQAPYTPPAGSIFFIHVEHETAGVLIPAGPVAIVGTSLKYSTQSGSFDLAGNYTVQIFGVVAATETTPAREYRSPVFTHRRLPNVGELGVGQLDWTEPAESAWHPFA